MKVAVIIVNYNDVDDTEKYVNTITKYDVINRIVVVDNQSTTLGTFETLKKLESEKVKVIQSEKNGGYDYGNNFGIRYLQKLNEEYDYYIISNPDISVTEEAIKHCLEVAENDSKIAVIAPRMFNKDNNPIRRSSWKMRTFWLDVVHSTRVLEMIFYKILRNGEYSSKDYEKEILEVEAISGAFFVIKAKILNEIGLFDEDVFLFYEEDILAKMLSERKYKTISLNSEKFIHYESQTIGKTFNYYKKMRQLFISKMYYHKKYNKINFLQIIVFHILNICRKIELLIEIPVRKLLKK
ncbi:MAG: glycosyltransferase family 2 protein [Clostridia bacterium]|nr:glycosyltransferase family 2 protein [Clostridia bacterium]